MKNNIKYVIMGVVVAVIIIVIILLATIANKKFSNDDLNSDVFDSDYKVFRDNFIKNRQEYYDTTVKNKHYFVVETGLSHTSDSDIILDNNGNLYYQKDNQKEKIATNVLNYKFLYTGNGGQRLLYFLKEDGTVSIAKGVSLATPESSNITFNKNNLDITNNIGGYKNIVSFIEGSVLYMGGAYSPMFVDIYGNMYSYDDGLKKEYDDIKSNLSYQIFKDNFIKNRVEYYDNTKDREYFERGPSGYIKLDNNGNLYYQKDNQKINIATNVLNYEFLYDGNGGQKTLYLLKEDGTVSFADGIMLVPSNNNELIIDDNIDIHNNVGGYKNIVSFIEANSSYCGNQICDDIASPIFIDIEGNMHNINLN